jgi:Asp-tRNA(Asn)/Glu-tRNA(Gln) amidotransferase A subunit family amidase
MAGLPALAAPAGKTKDGLTVGVQLIGPRRSDARLLQLAAEMEEAK